MKPWDGDDSPEGIARVLAEFEAKYGKFGAGAVTHHTPGGPIVVPGSYGPPPGWTPSAGGGVGVATSGPGPHGQGVAAAGHSAASANGDRPLLKPDFFRALCEAIADELCPSWRKGDVGDSILWTYDYQLKKSVKMPANSHNFTGWHVLRDQPALIRRLNITWGQLAVMEHRADHDKQNVPELPYKDFVIPVYVQITLDASRVAVDGFRQGSTRFNMSMAVGGVDRTFNKRIVAESYVIQCFTGYKTV